MISDDNSDGPHTIKVYSTLIFLSLYNSDINKEIWDVLTGKNC